jgi:hypothetical protein
MAQSTNTATARTDWVQPEGRVRDYDELDDRTQQFFLSTAGDGTVPAGHGLSQGDVVVFTDYYRVR